MKYTLGTICKLKGIDIKIIIIGYNSSSKSSGYTYNYVGCQFPEGFTDENKLYRFNNEHIENIIESGYDENNKTIEEPSSKLEDNSYNDAPNKTDNNDVKEGANEANVDVKSESGKEEYVFDENGVLVAVNKPQKQEEVKEEPKSNPEPKTTTLQSIDIANL